MTGQAYLHGRKKHKNTGARALNMVFSCSVAFEPCFPTGKKYFPGAKKYLSSGKINLSSEKKYFPSGKHGFPPPARSARPAFFLFRRKEKSLSEITGGGGYNKTS